MLVKLCRANGIFNSSVSVSLSSLHSTVAPNNCGLVSAAFIEYKFEQYHGNYQWFQSALHQMRGVKPPRVGKARQQYCHFDGIPKTVKMTSCQRRLAVIPVFEVVGVEPSPLFEWRIFGTFVSGQKYRKAKSCFCDTDGLLISEMFRESPAGAPRFERTQSNGKLYK